MPRVSRKMDLAGTVFGQLTAMERGPDRVSPSQSHTTWVCQCSCGNTCVVTTGRLRNGHTKSCGCLKKTGRPALNHGYCVNFKTRPEYWAWHNAKRRCKEPEKHNYYRYGGRGISMCEEWLHDFGAFIAHIGPRPRGRTLDRIDNDKGYQPGNVRWATPKQQAANRRKYTRRIA